MSRQETDRTGPGVLVTLARGLSAVIAWGGVILLLAWAVVRLIGDRVELLQIPSWAPRHAVFVGAVFAACSASLLIVGARRKGDRRTPNGLSSLWLCTLGLGAFIAIAEHRVHAVFSMAREGGAVGEGAVELLFWNQAGSRIDPEQVERLVGRSDPAIIADLHTRGGPGRVGRRFVRAGIFTIYTEREVIERRAQTLGFRATRFGVDPGPAAIDPGWFVRVVLGPSPDDPQPIELWLVDLPSDIRLHRMGVLERAAEAAAGLPEPDFILGDFNTPRGSRSLRRLVGRRSEASSSGGPYLLRGTWPRRAPFWHIDMLFPSERWRATGFRFVDPGGGTHRAIRARLERR